MGTGILRNLLKMVSNYHQRSLKCNLNSLNTLEEPVRLFLLHQRASQLSPIENRPQVRGQMG
jgi:hypothetical protein